MSKRDDELTDELRTLTTRTRATPREVAAAAARLAGLALDDHPHHRPLSETELEAEIDKGLKAADRGEFVDCTPQSILAEANGGRS